MIDTCFLFFFLFQINIFNLDKADSVKDIDRAILYALLKGMILWHILCFDFSFFCFAYLLGKSSQQSTCLLYLL